MYTFNMVTSKVTFWEIGSQAHFSTLRNATDVTLVAQCLTREATGISGSNIERQGAKASASIVLNANAFIP